MAAFKGTEVSESEDEKADEKEEPPFPEAKMCNLCRESGSLARPLGYVAFVQPSNLLQIVKTQKKMVREHVERENQLLADLEKNQEKEKEEERPEGLFVLRKLNFFFCFLFLGLKEDIILNILEMDADFLEEFIDGNEVAMSRNNDTAIHAFNFMKGLSSIFRPRLQN